MVLRWFLVLSWRKSEVFRDFHRVEKSGVPPFDAAYSSVCVLANRIGTCSIHVILEKVLWTVPMSEEQTPQSTRNITSKNLLDALNEESTSYEPIEVQKLSKTRAQKKKAMAQRLEKAIDRRDMAKEKMIRIHEGMTKPDKNIHWLNLQLENLRRCYDEVEKTYLEICDVVPRDQREGFKLMFTPIMALRS